jgi:hypothetical protein
MALCTLTDLPSWFTCAQSKLPFGELTCVVVLVVFYQLLRVGASTESGPTTGALLLTTLVALGLFGLGAIGLPFVFAMIILTALAAVVGPKL